MVTRAVAGTGQLYFCYAAAIRLLEHLLAMAFPDINNLRFLDRDHNTISKNSLAYHINKTVFHPFLTDTSVQKIELNEPLCLRSLFTFVKNVHEYSTLDQNPLVKGTA